MLNCAASSTTNSIYGSFTASRHETNHINQTMARGWDMEEDRFYWFSFLCCVKRRKAIKKKVQKTNYILAKKCPGLSRTPSKRRRGQRRHNDERRRHCTQRQRTRGSQTTHRPQKGHDRGVTGQVAAHGGGADTVPQLAPPILGDSFEISTQLERAVAPL